MASEGKVENVQKSSSQTSDDWVLKGGCFCGKVTFDVEGPYIFSVYCHCTLCQRLHGAPFVHFVGFPKDNLRITGGKDLLTSVESSENMKRNSCQICSTRIYNQSFHVKDNFVDLPAMVLERDSDGKIANRDKIAPTAHIFYVERALDVQDDLQKFKAYPGGDIV